MNKEDSLYIKKRFGNKILSILKRLAGGSSTDAPLVVKVTIGDRGERIPNKSAQEVLDAIREGKGVIYSISNGGNSNYCTSLVYCYGFYGEQNIPIIQVSYLDFTDGADNLWAYFSHVGNEIRDLITP